MKTFPINLIQVTFICLLGLLLATTTKAQNTFPGTGNVGLGTTSPARELHILGSDGLLRTESKTRYNWIEVFNNNGYIGYFGTYSGERDLDLGTGAGNREGSLQLVTQAKPRMTIDPNGRVGIGTTSPKADLDIEGNVFINSNKGNITYGYYGGDRFQFSTIGGGENLQLRSFNNANTSRMVAFFQQDGGVGINTNDVPAGYKLAVDGRVICEELKVQLSNSWPDYVFEDTYNLPSLEEVENAIEENGHLPGVPSAAAIEKAGGIEVGEMQRLMMEKIEELTLYMIELKKENKALKAKVAVLEAEGK